jgi:SnoaL-like polyketide cyclase
VKSGTRCTSSRLRRGRERVLRIEALRESVRRLLWAKPHPCVDAGRNRAWIEVHQLLNWIVTGTLLASTSCTSTTPMKQPDLAGLGTRYAAAWSSQNPALLASFYAENGSLRVNDGPPSVGRAAIVATAQGFMTAFPDMVVKMSHMSQKEGHPVFNWIWTGTNTGPGGTGRFVRITGYEEWTLNADGLIAESKGHYDEAEYQRQLTVGAPAQP